MKLKRLKIEKFRNIEPGTELVFDDGFNVLLGQNGSGKTTLLNLIASAFNSDFSWLGREPFEVEYDFAFEEADCTVHVASRPLPASPHKRSAQFAEGMPALSPPQTQNEVTAQLRVRLRSSSVEYAANWDSSGMSISGPMGTTSPVNKGSISWKPSFVWDMLLEMLEHVEEDSRLLEILNAFTVAAMGTLRFDESLDVFLVVTGRSSVLDHEREAASLSVLRGNAQNTWIWSLFPLPVVADFTKSSTAAEQRDIVIKHERALFLGDVVRLLGFQAAEMKFELQQKDSSDGGELFLYGDIKFLFTRRDGSIINQDLLSYGQKRLLTFFYCLACNPHVVIADELVNGLHHTWIAACIEAMEGYQVFLTSQNPLLLDYLSFESADQVRSTFITCQTRIEGERERLAWSNMSKKNADVFFRAYKVGVQHVGEILRTKGLW